MDLEFRKERTMLDSVLAEDVLVMPCKAMLKACAMSLPVRKTVLLFLVV
jgi:protein arginine N-methyltransferase 7